MFLLVWFLLEVFRLLVSEISTKIFDYSTLSLHLTFQHTHTHTTRTTKTHENNYFFSRKWKIEQHVGTNKKHDWSDSMATVEWKLCTVFSRRVCILLYFFFQNIYFSTERERERRRWRQVFSLPTTTPDNKTVSRWVGEAVEARGEEKWANASSQNQSAVFFLRRCFYWDFTANCVS